MAIIHAARQVSDDAAAILLLCAGLTKRRDAVSPLTTSEYDLFANILKQNDLRPRSLLSLSSIEIDSLLRQLPNKARERMPSSRVSRLLERGAQLAIALARWTSAGLWICTRADEDYPSRYKRRLGKGSPPIVFGVGLREMLNRGGLAVVGSRKPDPESVEYTKRVGQWAARTRVQIVSGAANGVDALSMVTCADAGGSAVGVVAENLLRLSTRPEFRKLIAAGHLTLISSFDPEAGFSVARAMIRNRWVYALSDRALVVATSDGKGGTWAGAIAALKGGERVYVRTGNPARPGNEALLRRERRGRLGLSHQARLEAAPLGVVTRPPQAARS